MKDILVRPRSGVSAAWSTLVDNWKRQSLLGRVGSVLQWDQNVMMPTSGGEERAATLSLMAESVHELKRDASYGAMLEEFNTSLCDKDGSPLTSFEQRSVWLALEEFRKGQAVSSALIARQSALRSRTQAAWVLARQSNNFGKVQPLLGDLLEVTRDIAAAQRESDPSASLTNKSLYDMLLGEYSRDFNSAMCTSLFDTFGTRLGPYVKDLNKNNMRSSSSNNNNSLLLNNSQPFELSKQKELSQRVLQKVFSSNKLADCFRLDESAHPFSIRLGSKDARITTRYNPNDLSVGLMGTLHECGHALYELGLPKGGDCGELTHYPAAQFIDIASHESQSLFWERCIGQSFAFSEWLAPSLWQDFSYGRWNSADKDKFPQQLHCALNLPSSTLIRVDADAVAYPLHVKVRFELERDLVDGKLHVRDLPNAWDSAFESTLGLKPTSQAEGVLQDVHFYAGYFGYFPSYSLGAVLAFQLWTTCEEALGGSDAAQRLIRSGDWQPIADWLADNVHAHGRMDRNALHLSARVSGKDYLDVDNYCDHLLANMAQHKHK